MDTVIMQVLIGILLLVVGWMSSAILEMKRQCKDLWVWHAPSSSGKQSWKWDAEEAMKELTEQIRELSSSMAHFANKLKILERGP